MQFFTEAVNVLKTLVIALGAGLAVWGVVNLLEGMYPVSWSLLSFSCSFFLCNRQYNRDSAE